VPGGRLDSRAVHIVLAIPVVAVGLWHLLFPRATPLADQVARYEKRERGEPTERDVGTVRIYGVLLLVLAVLLVWALDFLRQESATGPPADDPGHGSTVPLGRWFSPDRPSRVELPGDGPVRLRGPGLGRR
jgi:hypothetical protein